MLKRIVLIKVEILSIRVLNNGINEKKLKNINARGDIGVYAIN